jgi:hypothetical protein
MHHRDARKEWEKIAPWWPARLRRGAGVVLLTASDAGRYKQFADKVFEELQYVVAGAADCDGSSADDLRTVLHGVGTWVLVYAGTLDPATIEAAVEGAGVGVYVFCVGKPESVPKGVDKCNVVLIQRSARDCAMGIIKTVCAI